VVKSATLADRAASFLTRGRVVAWVLGLSLVVVAGYAVRLAQGDLPLDSTDQPITPDLAADLAGSEIVLNGAPDALYDQARQIETAREMFPGLDQTYYSPYISPPWVAYAYSPLALLPYMAASLVWTLLSVAAIVVALRLLWPLIPRLHKHGFAILLFLLLASRPGMQLLGGGQDSAFSLLLLVAGLRLLIAGRDATAGAVLGLGVFKPQLFILLPILFALQRRWTALVAWVAVAAPLTIFSVAVIGAEGVQDYYRLLTSDYYEENIAEGFAWATPSLLGLTYFLLPNALEPARIAAVCLVGCVLVRPLVRLVVRPADGPAELTQLYALCITLSALLGPHFLLYDMVILVVPITLFLNNHPAHAGLKVTLAAAFAITWASPIVWYATESAAWPLTVVGAPWSVLCVLLLYLYQLHAAAENRGAAANSAVPLTAAIGQPAAAASPIALRRVPDAGRDLRPA
jgi:Glycosyltransferase family 87